MASHFDGTREPYQHLVRGTPYAVYAGQARRNMRTLSQSSHPPMATPVSQSNSLPDQEQLTQRPALIQSYSYPTGYDFNNSSFYSGPSTTGGYTQQWPVYHSPVEQAVANMSAIPAWASDTARFYQAPTPVVNDFFQLPVSSQTSLAPVGTVQPSAIFGLSDFKDTSCPQTSLGTPATSARATPVDDESYLRFQQATRAGLPAEHWQRGAPKTDPVPTVKILHTQQTMTLSGDDDDRETSEVTESPLTLPVNLHAAPTKTVNGEKKKRTRTPQACEACRKRKAKCTGGQPCGRCTFKHLSCVFADIRPKIPPSTKTHHPTPASRVTSLSSPQQPKRRRHSDNARYNNEPVVQSSSTSPIETGPAYPVSEDKNLLQLRFDEQPYQPQTWATCSHPAYGYTRNVDATGFTALGFQQTYVPPLSDTASYLQTQYTYQAAPVDASVGSIGTPSISTNSSPSYGEASLLSPYDFTMYGQAPVDNYFPTAEA